MLHLDGQFSDRVAAAVAAIEKRTDAEIIVVAAERSGQYRDIAMAGASIVALVMFSAAVFAPFDFGALGTISQVVLSWVATAIVLNRRAFVRSICPAARQRDQVRAAAEMEFVREVVHGTPNRSGVLIYVSALEGRVELIPDLGLSGRVAPGEFAPVLAAFAHDDLDRFLDGLDRLGTLLARAVPHTEGSDATNLPDAPRIRL